MNFRTTQNDYLSRFGWYERGNNELVDQTPDVVVHWLWTFGDSGAEVTALEDIVCLQDWLTAITPEFVQGARKSGHSWAAIGTALGMTKQAAQQRFGASL